jgi:hypothetical protein
MAIFHNSLIHSLNTIPQQAPHISPLDTADFTASCLL